MYIVTTLAKQFRPGSKISIYLAGNHLQDHLDCRPHLSKDSSVLDPSFKALVLAFLACHHLQPLTNRSLQLQVFLRAIEIKI